MLPFQPDLVDERMMEPENWVIGTAEECHGAANELMDAVVTQLAPPFKSTTKPSGFIRVWWSIVHGVVHH